MGFRDGLERLGNGCSGLDKSDPASSKQGKSETGQPGMQLFQGEEGLRVAGNSDVLLDPF